MSTEKRILRMNGLSDSDLKYRFEPRLQVCTYRVIFPLLFSCTLPFPNSFAPKGRGSPREASFIRLCKAYNAGSCSMQNLLVQSRNAAEVFSTYHAMVWCLNTMPSFFSLFLDLSYPHVTPERQECKPCNPIRSSSNKSRTLVLFFRV